MDMERCAGAELIADPLAGAAPASRQMEAAGPAQGSMPGARRIGHRILIVDDSRSIRFLYRAVLEARGYVVLDAPDGLAGLEIALRERPDLIVSDMLMPGLDGVMMVERLRVAERAAGLQPIPVLLASAMPELPRFDAAALAIRAVLDKPHLSPRMVAEAVATHIEAIA